MNYNYEERRYMIVTSIVISLLILSIVGVSLILFLPRTPSNRPNTVNIGSRISRGRGFQSSLENADIWDGTSTTDWTGSGTEADPYLITKASQLAGLSTKINSATSTANLCSGQYFKLMKNLDMNSLEFAPIGRKSSNYPYNYNSFMGNFDGNGHTIVNLTLTPNASNAASIGGGLFGNVASKTNGTTINNSVTIKNLNIIYNYFRDIYGNIGYTVFGGLVGQILTDSNYYVNIDNVNIEYPDTTYSSGASGAYYGGLVGKIFPGSGHVNISNCTITGFKFKYSGYSNNSVAYGGIAGSANGTNILNCKSNACLTVTGKYDDTSAAIDAGGIVGYAVAVKIEDCLFDGDLVSGRSNPDQNGTTSHSYRMGGIVGYVSSSSSCTISNNLFQGSLIYYQASSTGDSYEEFLGGIVGGFDYSTHTLKNNISNGIFKSRLTTAEYELAGGVFGGSVSPTTYTPNAYNSSKTTIVSNANTPSWAYTGSTTDANMKLASTYADWENFDEHWVINSNINNGYPMLRAFVDMAKVTGFVGDGTESFPYMIMTYQDLLGMASYYNDNTLFEKTDIYWRLLKNINVSVDANGLPIHFTPICYNKEFDGYFDGNGYSISGLLIDNQYAYTGLFGTIGTNHWVKNLMVNGNIYWDQAYAVGGVAGRVMTGGYLENCTFTGNIIGVLNTKTSTECHGVVGNYGIGGAIDCSATYKDIKYAKIGGTANSPTYTYYLYDWAQINTNLYNRQVS